MARRWTYGIWGVRGQLSPLELTEKLAAIVPPFRTNQLLYAGVLAGKRGRDKLPDDAPLGWSAGPGPASKEGVRRRRLALPRLRQTHAPPNGRRGLPGGVDDHDELASVYGAAAAPGTAFQAQLSASNVADAMAAVDVLPPVMWE